MPSIPYDDPAAVLALEAELAAYAGCAPAELARDDDGCYEVMGMLEACTIRLVEHGPRRFVHVFAEAGRRLPMTEPNLAELNALNSALLGARIFLVDGRLFVSAELPLSALGTGELKETIGLVTEAVLASAFFPDRGR